MTPQATTLDRTPAKDKATGREADGNETDEKTGSLVPAKEAPSPNVPSYATGFYSGIYVCMIYGPIAAYLVEAFPAKIRYTSLSASIHIGNGVFWRLLPLIGYGAARNGNIYAGLY